MKSDPAIIADLPAKTEVKAYCNLSRRQAAHYLQAIQDLAKSREDSDGMQRKGIVLAAMMRFKQICSHPSHWLNDHHWAEADSGKFARLREIAEVIAARQEKMLVFSQFRETTEPLAAFLARIFGRPGLVLHANTAVRQRNILVQRFQEDEAVPFFVLSLKAGGTGLTLTAAIACRAFRPLVESGSREPSHRPHIPHRTVEKRFSPQIRLPGTVEEKIDALIDSKQQMSHELLAGGAEVHVTELTDDELLRLVGLDLHTAMEE
jgi:SNF2 family DNA or RNA helicase